LSRFDFSKMTHCQRNHDLRVAGVVETDSRGYRRCVDCRRERGRNYERKKAVGKRRDGYCVAGHLLSGDNVRVTNRKSGKVDRICRACSRLSYKRYIRLKQPKVVSPDQLQITARILDLAELRERAMTPWHRAEIQQQIDALRTSTP
jgi:hypothetical protein